jgi:hypothetical protein
MKKGDVEEPLRDDMVAVALLKEGPHVSLNVCLPVPRPLLIRDEKWKSLWAVV